MTELPLACLAALYHTDVSNSSTQGHHISTQREQVTHLVFLKIK